MIQETILIDRKGRGERLDKFLADAFPGFSRSEVQVVIRGGGIEVNGGAVLPKYKLKTGDVITITLERIECVVDQPEDIPLRIVYEDDTVMIINKPPGLTVHPGAAQKQGTLLNALLHHNPALSILPRAGIVHRLDKDTAGLMVVAKTAEARLFLIESLKKHEVERRYVALVVGNLAQNQTINVPIGRHPIDRIKMAALPHSEHAKEAVTHISILKRFQGCTLIQARLETGRTHQIRVHLAHLGYPLVGDKVYGHKKKGPAFHRQALQAEYLSFVHPSTKMKVDYQILWEDDLNALIYTLCC